MNIKHNMRYTPEYKAWGEMKSRCYNPNSTSYLNYGGRGIKVCDRWLNSFTDFIKDMGKKPSAKYSLDRIDTNGNYEPSNCRWATRSIQIHNRRGFGNTKILGVHKTRGGYQALITKNYKRYFLGTFKTLSQAHEAYKLKEAQLYV